MAFVRRYGGVLISKARRAKALRGRPAWQTVIPDTPEGRDTYRIAAKYEDGFAADFLDAVAHTFDGVNRKAFVEAYNSGSEQAAIQALGIFSDDPENDTWRKFGERLQSSYLQVIQESGEVEAARLQRDFDVDMGFSVAKAKRDETKRIKVVPVNPHSIKWVEERSLELVSQGIAEVQREVVRRTLLDGFAKGSRAENVYDTIKRNIGLTDREVGAVINRAKLLSATGDYSPVEVAQITNAYREKLLEKRAARIARTETIQAQARGREDAWRLADEANLLPEVERVWMAAPNACEFCEEMDGLTAPIDGYYESPTFGAIEGPTLHPHCGCSEILQRKEGA